jgi:hypothetical protein
MCSPIQYLTSQKIAISTKFAILLFYDLRAYSAFIMGYRYNLTLYYANSYFPLSCCAMSLRLCTAPIETFTEPLIAISRPKLSRLTIPVIYFSFHSSF